MNQEKSKIIGLVSLHISNSGISFSIKDEGFGPTIVIRSAAYGNINTEIKVLTDTESLQKLSDLFALAASQNYSPDYCHKACTTS